MIEHLERDAALELIADLERLARRRVVIFTPDGFVPVKYHPGGAAQQDRLGPG